MGPRAWQVLTLVACVVAVGCGRLDFQRISPREQGGTDAGPETGASMGDAHVGMDAADHDSGTLDAGRGDGAQMSSDAGARDGDAARHGDAGTLDAGDADAGSAVENGTCPGPYDMTGGRELSLNTCDGPDSVEVCGSSNIPNLVFTLAVGRNGCEVNLDGGETGGPYNVQSSTGTDVCGDAPSSCLANIEQFTYSSGLAGTQVYFAIETESDDCGEVTVDVRCP